MGVLFLLFYVLVAHASSSAYSTQTPHDSRLLILFLDGLRWDYLSEIGGSGGGIGQMCTQGCHIPRVKPVFPSNCYANVHAIFAGHNSTRLNIFSDVFDAKYTHPELLWNRAIRLGKSAKLYNFPFCSNMTDLGVDCIFPTSASPSSLKSTLQDAVGSLHDRSLDLAVVYYGELDKIAHEHGPSSKRLRKGDVIAEIDDAVSAVIESLEGSGINFAIVADHGMTEFIDTLSIDRIFLWKDVERIVNLGSSVGVWPRPGVEQELIKTLSTRPNHFTVYTPETMPPVSWQVVQLPPIILVAEPGYLFNVEHHPMANWDDFGHHHGSGAPRGCHGYMPHVEDMQTTFLGYGPAFDGGANCASDGSFTYEVFPLLHRALTDHPPTAAKYSRSLTGPVPSVGGLLIGFAITLVAVGLILLIAIKRLTKARRRQDELPLAVDFNDEEEDSKV